MKTTVAGIIGNHQNMIPTKKTISFGEEKVEIYTFKLFELGKRGGESVQVNLRVNEKSDKIMQSLTAGRRVIVEGKMSFNPNGRIVKNELQSWANPTIWAQEIIMADQKIETVFSNCFEMMEETSILSNLIIAIKDSSISNEKEMKEFLLSSFKELAEVKFHSGRDEDALSLPSDKNPLNDGPL